MSHRRTLELIQRRIVSFLAIHLGIALALTILLIGLKNREVPCQELSHELLLPIFVSPSLDNATLMPAVLDALTSSGLNAHLNHRVGNGSGVSGTYWSIDTSGNLLQKNSYQLLRQRSSNDPDHDIVHIRYVNEELCVTVPRLLDVNHNVDRDTVVSRRLSELLDNRRVFLHETVLRSATVVPLTKFVHLENLVPSLRDLIGDAHMAQTDVFLVSNEMSYSVQTNAPLLSNGVELPVSLVVEEWTSKAGDREFWKVSLRCSNPRYEGVARGLLDALLARLSRWTVEMSPFGIASQY